MILRLNLLPLRLVRLLHLAQFILIIHLRRLKQRVPLQTLGVQPQIILRRLRGLLVDCFILIMIVPVQGGKLFVPHAKRFMMQDLDLVDGLAPLAIALGFVGCCREGDGVAVRIVQGYLALVVA